MLNFVDRFEQAFYYSPIGMAILSLDGQWLKVNPALSKLTGYTEEELLSLTYQDITHPDDVEEDNSHMRALYEGKKDSFEMEKRYFHKNGSIVWVLLSVSVVREGDQALFVISQVQDITARKQLEFELIDSEKRFRNLITSLPDPILVYDGDKILFANPSAANIAGTSVQELIGKSYREFLEPEQVELAQNLTMEILEKDKPLYDYDGRVLSKNGEAKDIIISAIPITYLGKLAVLVSFRDITDRKKMERALIDSEERYRHLIDYSPLGIVIHQNRAIQYVNTTATRLLGASNSNELVGLNIYKVILPDDRFVISSQIETIERGEFLPTCSGKFVRLDGQVIDVELNGIPIQINGESAVQVVFWDITEKKKEEDLVRYRAYHDTLTDLPNRLKFQLDLEEEINKDTMFTIMYVDLHGLKPVNDTYGHQAGDMVLIKVTSRLSGVLDSMGLLYRIGGDEFAVVLPGKKSESEISQIVNKMIDVMKQPIYITNSIVEITASIGVVFSPEHGVEMSLLLRHADLAMYHAKKTNTLYKIYDN